MRMARMAARWALAAGVYLAAAKLGLAIAFLHGTVSAVWPPTGVALVTLLVGGPRMLPAIFAGEFLADVTNHTSVPVSAAFGVGSMIEASVGYGLLRWAGGARRLADVRAVLALVVLAAPVSTALCASVGTGALLAAGDVTGPQLWGVWHVWWLGDLSGDLVLAPLLLVALAAWERRRESGRGRPAAVSPARLAEWGAFLATVGLLAAAAGRLTLGFGYLMLPVLIWAAVRFRMAGAVMVNTVLCGLGMLAAADAGSQLQRVSLADRLLFTQNFVAVGAVTTLVLAAAVVERDRTAERLRASELASQALAAEQAALNEVAVAVARDADPSEIFAMTAEQTARLAGGAAGLALRWDGGAQAHIVGVWTRPGQSPAWSAGTDLVLASSGAAAGALRTGEPNRQPPRGPHARFGERVAAPVRVAGRVWGVLAVVAETGALLPADCEARVERFAELVGTAIAGADARLQLQTEAATDPLTGLANRRAFGEQLQVELLRAARYGRPLAVAVFDIDWFKRINDTAGHPAGDSVLVEVARRVVGELRSEGTVARFGGDEIVALIPECDAAGALLSAERVRRAVSGLLVDGHGRVTVSAGVADVTDVRDGAGGAPDREEVTAEELVRQADQALYRAKASGRDRCVRYAPLVRVPALAVAEPGAGWSASGGPPRPAAGWLPRPAAVPVPRRGGLAG